MTEEKKKSLHPISKGLYEVYKSSFIDSGEVSFPFGDEQMKNLDSVVKTVFANYYGFDRFPSNELKAAAFFCLIIKDHPVMDGNKRLAVLWLQVFCDVNNIMIGNQANQMLDGIAVAVENIKDMPNDDLFGMLKIVLFDL